MLRRALTLAVAAAAGTLACENVTETSFSEGMATAEFSKGPVVQSVTGSGHLRGERGFSGFRSFSFSAREYSNGVVKGQWQAFGRAAEPPTVVHGRVTCFTIEGNTAWVAGIIDRSSSPDEVPAGQERGWKVVDNGEGAGADPDQISITVAIPDGYSAADWCDSGIGVEMHPVQYGNIQIRG